MIAYVRGVLVEKEPTRVVLEAGGLGYELVIPLSTYDKLPHTGESVKLLAYHAVREDDETLFGFADTTEREMFGKLTSVSGVGPKIAIAILSGLTVGDLATAIVANDAKRIAAIKGVGKKTAEKICVDLRDRVNGLLGTGARAGAPGAKPVLADAVTALRALGFNEETSAKMVADVAAKNPTIDSLDQLIRLALAAR